MISAQRGQLGNGIDHLAIDTVLAVRRELLKLDFTGSAEEEI